MRLEGIATFIAIVEAGSLSAAARRLNVSKSVVSERLKELERSLGASLIQRTTRNFVVTEEGSAFAERARRILGEATAARSEIAERGGSMAGPLRVSAPVSFGTLHLGRALYPFLLANPAIQLTLDLDDRFVDVAAGGYDAVIRHGKVVDARVVVKRIAASRRFLVASPAYLKRSGVPRTVTDLEAHMAILYVNRETDWRFKSGRSAVVVRPSRYMLVNNGLVMRDAAIAGVGITLLPAFLIGSELASGSLRIVDVGAAAEPADIFVAYPSSRSSAKVRGMVEALRTAFAKPPWELAQ
jgi:DNA-binding transcriptional LysR family regulator